ncbi:hypothetical protein A9G29_08695 [Gilliamella sp. Fer2-1]|jgi:hypothetical protein|uniref:hypothetical protein n=1 Tax=unclassified Gilliamella TaxID=2685620 RepID=UPI00080F3D42|nr:hypothetical protein [Gilliamella apicola]OCG39591.1 hypothetical protein A9G29_08695 [Gilliamella apicola]OCG71682.1 hypothetical protein A9G41_02475 [Gilliamella apicola]OCG72627.1 hypothetical protein A9G42_12175 [Gilliamella apicola]
MKVPTHLARYIKDYKMDRLTTMALCSENGNNLFEIWYYGELCEIPREEQLYIIDTNDAPTLIVARNPSTKEDILLFDGAKHGYNNMFCDTFDEETLNNRTLQKYEIPASQIIIEIGYNIDYEEEKEYYEFDENGRVLLINGGSISWEDLITDGFDCIALSYVDDSGKIINFLDVELA